MNICSNCKSLYRNKIRRDKGNFSNYDEKINVGSHTNIVLLSPERLKQMIKNKSHRRKVLTKRLRSTKIKPDNLKDEVEAKVNEG